MRVLVAGWFSIEHGGATAGDDLVRDVVCGWLRDYGIPFDVAQEPAEGSGVDWFRVSPKRYTHLVFACGPVGRSLAVRELIERFSSCTRIGVNVSLVDEPGWQPFDLLLERDGAGTCRPDLALVAPLSCTPVVAVVRTHLQTEYRGSRPLDAHNAFERLLARREAAAYDVDTILDPRIPGRRSPAEVQALLARADAVLTSRLDGLVLALAAGIPAVAVDSVEGGAKVTAQAQALRWPAALTVGELDDAGLERWFDWCLSPAARERADACRHLAAAEAERIRATLTAYLGGRQQRVRARLGLAPVGITRSSAS